MNQISTVKDLEVYKLSHKLILKIYRITKKFPNDERYGLISQLRRACVSISANLTEGAAHLNRKEYRQFAGIARGSVAEIICLLKVARDLGYVSENEFSELNNYFYVVGKMMTNLIKSLSKK